MEIQRKSKHVNSEDDAGANGPSQAHGLISPNIQRECNHLMSEDDARANGRIEVKITPLKERQMYTKTTGNASIF